MTTFRYMTVEEWGGVWTRPPIPEVLQDPECYVHHTAGNPYSNLDAVQAFRNLNAIAQQGKGYSFLDYDYLVHYNVPNDVCTIGEGRGKWLSAATKDRNELGEAIVAMGYFHPGSILSQQPPPAIIEGLARGIVRMRNESLIAPNAKILGHKDNPAHPGATGCPGDYLYARLPDVKARVHEIINDIPHQGGHVAEKFTILDPPLRIKDTRKDGDRLTDETIIVDVPYGENAVAAEVTITAVSPTRNGHITCWGAGARPTASCLNMSAGQTAIANTTTVPLANGDFKLAVTGDCHVVIDLVGIWSE